jgi:hypothetical protein
MRVSAQHYPAERSRFWEEKGGNSLFPEAKERTIADCRDKIEIPIQRL